MKERMIVTLVVTLLVLSIVVGVLQSFSTTAPVVPRAQIGGPAWIKQDGIAVVSLFGEISGPQEEGLFGTIGGVDSVIDEIEMAARLDKVKALVLRINSPGGTVGASQELHDAVVRFKETEKPLIVSVTELCASGGYYMACPADIIVANPGAIVGSVGVIMIVPNYTGLLEEKLGISFNVVKSGKWKDAGSPFREMTREERERFQKEIGIIYQQFLDAVIEGRANHGAQMLMDAEGLDYESARARAVEVIEESAQGQIFVATEAIDNFFVDEIGSFHRACEIARSDAGLPWDAPIHKMRSTGLKALLGEMGVQSRSPVAQQLRKLELGPRLEYRYVPGI